MVANLSLINRHCQGLHMLSHHTTPTTFIEDHPECCITLCHSPHPALIITGMISTPGLPISSVAAKQEYCVWPKVKATPTALR